MKKLLSVCISSILCVCSTGAQAYDEATKDDGGDDLLSMSLEDLLNIEVAAASKFSQKPREAPAVISVITKQQVEDYGWLSINEVLYSQPGFGPGKDFERNTVPTRGFSDSWSNNHILHLVDGLPINDNQYGGAYTSEITPLIFTESLEIIRGPGSALYGSNATNGVVQMNTVSAKNLSKKAYVRSYVGEDNTKRVDTMVAHQGENIGAVFAYSWNETNGNEYKSHDGSGRVDANNNLFEGTTNDNRDSSYAWAKLEVGDSVNVQFHHQQWSFDTGHGWLWWIPDFKEDMHESRDILSIKYQPQSDSKLQKEFSARYQKHNIDWNMRFYPTGAFEDFYPSGMWELLSTDTEDLFLRTQFSYQADNKQTYLLGVEADVFLYGGDKEHFSNIDVDGDFSPFPGDINTRLGPWLDYIVNKPLVNIGIYGQWTTGELLGKDWVMTLGTRWDQLSFDYHDINLPNRPTVSKNFSKISPRLAFVYTGIEDVSVKLMAGKAFRAPTPTELAGAHTFTLASNIAELQPELITTFEAMVDWTINKNVTLRGNIFQTEFENQIAFSTQNNNLSTNVFSQTSQGIELELLFGYGQLSGFTNFSYAKRTDEKVLDNTISQSPNDLVNEPDIKLNAGVNYRYGKWQTSASIHYQGKVNRRLSEVGSQELPLGVGVTLNLNDYRSQSVSSWTELNLKLERELVKGTALGLKVTNALGSNGKLAKSGPFPFDYQRPGSLAQIFVRSEF